MWQHDETGRIGFVDAQQIEWGWASGNPRCKIIGPLYTHPSPQAGVAPVSEGVKVSDERILELAKASGMKALLKDWFDFASYREVLAFARSLIREATATPAEGAK
jgi:hypothetical protein